jgi:hypothetical protein
LAVLLADFAPDDRFVYATNFGHSYDCPRHSRPSHSHRALRELRGASHPTAATSSRRDAVPAGSF